MAATAKSASALMPQLKDDLACLVAIPSISAADYPEATHGPLLEVIGDMGSFRPGVPTLTVALRGMAMITVEARTLAGPKHSGQFGGAAPDGSDSTSSRHGPAPERA